MVANTKHNNANLLRIFMIMLAPQAAAAIKAPDRDCQYNCQYVTDMGRLSALGRSKPQNGFRRPP
jgi:hypothetical protein